MDDFRAVRIKKRTLSRFKVFSKKVGKSYSHTLDMVMDFFEWHGFLPSERFEKSIGQEIIKNRKRTDAVIAIIRDIEKNQTLPTIGMMQALFNQELDNDEEGDDFLKDMIEKNPPKPYPVYEGEVTVPRIKYEHLEEKAAALQTDLNDILDKVKVVKSSFGKSYLKLEITEGRLERYKLEVNRPLDSQTL
ncbi:BfmA/BtgA family mobilization protein [Flagellimonas amoyensis]|uniref:BfmA/BtgA family mobilization protein n=1 Tax=Flagellimonas amoyensis TaxID=2169401 RepID=UPI000D399303|nr:BfmA/BtgA family mobilization protein [Allomuricauda amoyensis]